MFRPLLLAALSATLPAPLPSAPAKAMATLQGEMVVKGRILKLKTKAAKFNPYAGVYKSAKAPVELEQHTLIYLEGLRTGKVAPDNALLAQKERNFTSSIVPVLGGGSVDIRNDDTVRHHVRCQAKPWDFNLKPRAPGETVARKFAPLPLGQSLGVAPVYCDIHPNMRSHILVLASDKWQLLPEGGGKFSLKGIPPGSYTLTAWHPTLKPEPVKVTLKAGETVKVKLAMLGKED